jgi:hypothetical protein
VRTLSSNWLAAFVFAVALASGVWVGGRFPVAWAVALLVGAMLGKRPFTLELPDVRVRVGLRDVALTLLVAAPALVNLVATWRQEFPTSGDQFLHNAYALEAHALWWPYAWLAAIAAIAGLVAALRRDSRSPLPLIGIAILAALAMIDLRGSISDRYPALLHFLSVPFRALLPLPSPIAAERLVNTLSIPVWLLLLRPRLLGRRVDVAATAAGLLLFWQKDVVYYVTSGYLEPWAVVLLLTAGEHLLRFGREAVWRPLLLIGTAALIKEQAILALPVVALLFFPRRNRIADLLNDLLVVAAAAMPFALYAAHPTANVWRGAGFVWPSASHAALWQARVLLQFGPALPLVGVALAALLFLALRNRGATALAVAVAVDAGIFYFAAAQQKWPGYPRTNLIPLALVAIAFGFLIERFRWAPLVLALTVTLNAIPLLPFLRDGFGPSDTRNFFEHTDASIFYPIRETLARQTIVPPGRTLEILNNGKRVWPLFYPGPFAEQYPDLAARWNVRLGSFRDVAERCACSSDSAKLAVFVRFTNLGATLPSRPAAEAEAAKCRAAMEATCARRMAISHDGNVVALLGSR